MSDKVERPELVEDEHLTYLDDLRESGDTNMFGAGSYLEDEFGLHRFKARTVLQYWMKSHLNSPVLLKIYQHHIT